MTTERLRPAIRRQTAFVRTLLDELDRRMWTDTADTAVELADELERLGVQLVQEANSLRTTVVPPVLQSRVKLVDLDDDGTDAHERVTLRAGG